jgi:hypothetical protein
MHLPWVNQNTLPTAWKQPCAPCGNAGVKKMLTELFDVTLHNANPDPAVLVFPATHQDGLSYMETAREHGLNVVAASSEWDSEIAREVGELVVLPYVYDPEFPARFLELLKLYNINRVYAPVAAVHIWLDHFISKNNLQIQLVGGSPTHREMNRFAKLVSKVKFYRAFIDQCSGGMSDLSDLEIAAVFRMTANIYGESNEYKIAAMMAIFSSVPKGDVIEIGSLAGKSAAVLTFLARRYNTGNILAIDPWQWKAGTQHDSPETVSVHMADSWDYDMLLKNFAVNMIPIGLGSFNYLQQESAQGFELYRENPSVVSHEFGQTNYQGKIAIIHIDGNHDYAKVKLDCELWLPLLTQGAWLILDDYLWIHGDGPHRVGDSLLELRENDIERAFICGKALFIKFH